MSCSFCGLHSHNIRNCENPIIETYYEQIKLIYVEIMNQHQLGHLIDVESRFKSVLNSRFELRKLRGVCAKHTNYRTTPRSKTQIIHMLYVELSSNIHLQNQQQHHTISDDLVREARILPLIPEPIPDFERDLEEQHESQEEHNITWYMDTTPSPVSIMDNRMFVSTDSPTPITFEPRIYHSGVEGNRIDYWTQFGDAIRYLNPDFEAVAIPRSAPPIKKYDILPMLVIED